MLRWVAVVAMVLGAGACAAPGDASLHVIALRADTVPAGIKASDVRALIDEAAAYYQRCGLEIRQGDGGGTIEWVAELDAVGHTWGEDIELNASEQWELPFAGECDGQVDVARLLYHEMGHVVGLEHESDPRSFMFGPAMACTPVEWSQACGSVELAGQ